MFLRTNKVSNVTGTLASIYIQKLKLNRIVTVHSFLGYNQLRINMFWCRMEPLECNIFMEGYSIKKTLCNFLNYFSDYQRIFCFLQKLDTIHMWCQLCNFSVACNMLIEKFEIQIITYDTMVPTSYQ